MQITFWGVRGSIPTPIAPDELESKIASVLVEASGRTFKNAKEAKAFLRELPPLESGTAGGNTACLEAKSGEDTLIIDAGSGLRELGRKLMGNGFVETKPPVNILMSHTHWDHICAFPFFTPVYIPGASITLYGCHDELEARFRNQNHPYNFPVLFENMAADLTFVQLETDRPVDINGFQVTAHAMHHPGDSYAYKLQRDGKTFVYATDASYNDLTPDAMGEFVEFYRDADALVFDAHFDDLIESFEKSDWGHSSSFIGVDISLNANVKRLILFHHDHLSDDARLTRLIESTHNYLNHVADSDTCEVILGREGLVLEL